MEKPAIFATLFPDEQMALPGLWKLLEAPFPVVNVNGLASDLTITDKRVEPSGLVMPASLAISSLPAEYQMLAKRVQLVFNADGNATTIEIADIDGVLVMPQAFTPGEVEQLKAIRLIFVERATSNCEAKAVVPAPGHTSATTTFGTMSLELTRDVAIRERRYMNGNSWNAQLTLESDAGAKLTTPAPGKIVAVELGTGAEYLIEDGAIGSPQSTSLIIERYDNGARQEAHNLALPPIDTRHNTQGMQAFVDYTLELANNTALIKYPVATPAGTTTIVDFEYGVTAMPNPLVDLNRVAAVATPPITIPTGRYSIDLAGFGKVAMDVYPGSVVMLGGQKANPTYYSQTDERVLYVDSVNQRSTRHFTPATNELYVWWYPGNVSKTTVRASMRTQ
jgi:hypothetical protein